MAAREVYHSALSPPLVCDPWPAGVVYTGPLGSQAFVHDVAAGPHPIHSALGADAVVYCEPPWRDGYDKFNARVGKTGVPTFREFMAGLDAVARAVTVPVVYVIGKSALSYVRPDTVRPVGFVTPNWSGAYQAFAVCYRLPDAAAVIPAGATSAGVIAALAVRYATGCDFVAGYGRTGRVFAAAGRRFVLSDFDARCVGYVAAHAAGWFPSGATDVTDGGR